jgi:hypothetical protein
MTQTVTINSPEFIAAPRTIRDLITMAIKIGGEVEMPVARRYEFLLPCKFVGGAKRNVNRAHVGYYVKDGKNVIGAGIYEVRREIAYWARQSA